jgi:hypothetical protein
LKAGLRHADTTGMLDRRTTILLSAGVGVCLELGIHALSSRREAWDSPLFWTLGLPAAALASAAIGYFARAADWRWTAIVVPSQVVTMMVRSGERPSSDRDFGRADDVRPIATHSFRRPSSLCPAF